MIIKDMYWEGRDLHVMDENDKKHILKDCFMSGYEVMCDKGNNTKEDIENNIMNVTITFETTPYSDIYNFFKQWKEVLRQENDRT